MKPITSKQFFIISMIALSCGVVLFDIQSVFKAAIISFIIITTLLTSVLINTWD